MIRIISPTDLQSLNLKERGKVIDVTVNSKTWGRKLSPSVLGPIGLYQGHRSHNFEDALNFMKVYPEHVGALNLPTEDYWNWACDGWSGELSSIHPFGQKPALYSYWDGYKYNEIGMRKNVLIPLYSRNVFKNENYSRLEREYHNNDLDIILFDYNGYDHDALGMSLADVINCEERPMSHAFVLKMMLLGMLD